MSAMMLAFVMGARPRAQQMPASSAPTAAAQAAPAGDSDNGRKILVKYGCAQCHGREGQGAPIAGPRIGPSPLPFASFAKYVRAPTGQMPPYTAKVVTDQELADIRAFLASRPRPPAAAQDLLPPE
jgi:ubiquinol-cytochrome c reductase cytochrome c subunit